MEFGSILFHRLPEDFSDSERERLIEELKEVLQKFGAEFDEYQFAGYSSERYTISKCVRCGDLTLDEATSPGELETGDIFDAIARVLRPGTCCNGECWCNECRQSVST